MFFDDEIEFCASLLKESDPLRFRSIMAAPEKLRPYYFVIFALNVEVSRAPYLTKEPLIADIRLQWWLDVLDEIIGDKTVRKHAVATPLSKCIGKGQAKELKKFVLARKWDIHSDEFNSLTALNNYLYETTGILFQVAAGSNLVTTNKYFHDACMAIALANYLMATPDLKRAGKLPFAGLSPIEIGEQCGIAMANLKTAKSHKKNFTERERWVLFTGWKSEKILTKIFRNPENLESIVSKLEQQRMTFAFVWKAILKTF
jgi:phytoene/squalene synthetase